MRKRQRKKLAKKAEPAWWVRSDMDDPYPGMKWVDWDEVGPINLSWLSAKLSAVYTPEVLRAEDDAVHDMHMRVRRSLISTPTGSKDWREDD